MNAADNGNCIVAGFASDCSAVANHVNFVVEFAAVDLPVFGDDNPLRNGVLVAVIGVVKVFLSDDADHDIFALREIFQHSGRSFPGIIFGNDHDAGFAAFDRRQIDCHLADAVEEQILNCRAGTAVADSEAVKIAQDRFAHLSRQILESKRSVA